jgi:hypothetical protein
VARNSSQQPEQQKENLSHQNTAGQRNHHRVFILEKISADVIGAKNMKREGKKKGINVNDKRERGTIQGKWQLTG